MKITLEIDCEVDGEWKPEYEDDVITGLVSTATYRVVRMKTVATWYSIR